MNLYPERPVGCKKKGIKVAIIGVSASSGYSKNIFEIFAKLLDKGIADNHNERCNECDINSFDYEFFGLSKVMAGAIRPEFRKYLEAVCSAVEDAGIIPKTLENSDTAVFSCCSLTDLYSFSNNNAKECGCQKKTGYKKSMCSNLISSVFKLRGISQVIDTDDSSAMECIYRAAESLENHECKLAIVGGVTSKAIKDAAGEVQIALNGCISFVLKPLEDAIASNDNIYGVIESYCHNFSYSTVVNGSPDKQSIENIFKNGILKSEISPENITYLCCSQKSQNNTSYLIKVFQDIYRNYTINRQYCCYHDINSLISQTGCISGFFLILQVIMQMKYSVIPAGCNTLSIDMCEQLINSAFYINRKPIKWSCINGELSSCLSIFGSTGFNSLLCISGYTRYQSLLNIINDEKLFCISAKNKDSLIKNCENYCVCLNDIECDYDDFIYTYMFRRTHYNHRFACVYTTYSDLAINLKKFIDGNKYEGYYNVTEEKCIKLTSDESLSEKARLYTEGWTPQNKDIKLSSKKIVSLPSYSFSNQMDNIKETYNITDNVKRKKYDLINGNIIELESRKIADTNLTHEQYWELYNIKEYNNQHIHTSLYMEMILQFLDNKCPVRLENIKFLSPMCIKENHDNKLYFECYKQNTKNNKQNITVRSKSANKWLTHVECTYQKGEVSKLQSIDLSLCKMQYTERMYSLSSYSKLFAYKQLLNSTETSIFRNPDTNEYMCKIILDDKMKMELNKYYIHPFVLEIALNFVVRGFIESKIYYPVSCESMDVFSDISSSVIYIISSADVSSQQNDINCNVDLYNESGNPVLLVRNYCFELKEEKSKNKRTAVPMYNYRNYKQCNKPDTNRNTNRKVLIVVESENSKALLENGLESRGFKTETVWMFDDIKEMSRKLYNKTFDSAVVKFDDSDMNEIETAKKMLKISETMNKVMNNCIFKVSSSFVFVFSASEIINNNDKFSLSSYVIRNLIEIYSEYMPDFKIRCIDIDNSFEWYELINELFCDNYNTVVYRNKKRYVKVSEKSDDCIQIIEKNFEQPVIVFIYDMKLSAQYLDIIVKKGYKKIILLTNEQDAEENQYVVNCKKLCEVFEVRFIHKDNEWFNEIYNTTVEKYGYVAGIYCFAIQSNKNSLYNQTTFERINNLLVLPVYQLDRVSENNRECQFVVVALKCSNIDYDNNIKGYSNYMLPALMIKRKQKGNKALCIRISAKSDDNISKHILSKSYLYSPEDKIIDKYLFSEPDNTVIEFDD